MTEQLYKDFTEKVLPSIETGLTITKEYFQDLFSRYVEYLIVFDIAIVSICFIVFLVSLYFTFSIIPKWHAKGDPEPYHNDRGIAWVPAIVIMVLSFIGMIDHSNKLIKDLYIPEIRIYEELKTSNLIK